jgi:hypothetical protein
MATFCTLQQGFANAICELSKFRLHQSLRVCAVFLPAGRYLISCSDQRHARGNIPQADLQLHLLRMSELDKAAKTAFYCQLACPLPILRTKKSLLQISPRSPRLRMK